MEDGHLDNARLERGRLDDHLGGPAKGAIAHAEPLQQIHPNGAKRADVREAPPVAPGNEPSDKASPQGGMRRMLAIEPSGAKDEIRPASQDRGQHRGQFLRTLTAVPIEEDDNLGGRAAGSHTSPARGAVTPARLRHDSGAGANGDPGGVIGGAIVDHDDLVHDSSGNPQEERTDDVRLVECWNDERGLHEGLSGARPVRRPLYRRCRSSASRAARPVPIRD